MITANKCLFFWALFLLLGFSSRAQLFMTRDGFAGFYSKTAFEDIKAENNQVYAVLDYKQKTIAVSLLLKGFIFPKQLMQDHFNENYVESDKFPKAGFAGTISGEFSLDKPGSYPVIVKGNLTLHGVVKPIEEKVHFEVRGGLLLGTASFQLQPEDFNISIPAIVREKVSRNMRVEIRFQFSLAQK